MKRALAALLALLFACLEFWASDKPGQAPGISAAPSEDLVRVYGELRSLQVGEQSAVTERSEEHTSELQSRLHLVCRLLLEKKKKKVVKRINIDTTVSRKI